MDDLKGGGDFMSADPVRVFRQHYGDDAFDLIPDQEAFGMGPSGYGPTSQERVRVLEKVIGKPITYKRTGNSWWLSDQGRIPSENGSSR